MMRLYADDGFGNLLPLHPVELATGVIESSYSEAWRHECECRAIMRVPSLQKRRDWLYGVPDWQGRARGGLLQRRGQAAIERMEATMLFLWRQEQQVKKVA